MDKRKKGYARNALITAYNTRKHQSFEESFSIASVMDSRFQCLFQYFQIIWAFRFLQRLSWTLPLHSSSNCSCNFFSSKIMSVCFRLSKNQNMFVYIDHFVIKLYWKLICWSSVGHKSYQCVKQYSFRKALIRKQIFEILWKLPNSCTYLPMRTQIPM